MSAVPADYPIEYPTLHPATWVFWVAGVVVALTSTRNPWFVGAVLVLIGLVLVQQRRIAASRTDTPVPAVEIGVLRFGLVVVTTSAIFNVLMVHIGEHVLFTLPPALPLIGGPITLEALVYGVLNGLVLAGLFAAFSVLNRVLPVRSLLRLVPRAYYPAAVVMSIAVTFAPSALQQIQQVREAQAVRGHRMAGVRSWLPLLVPLLEGSLERSMQLAEAMMARGFAAGEAAVDRRPQLLMLCGMAAFLAGWLLRLAWQQEAEGWALLFGGTLLLLAAKFTVSALSRRSASSKETRVRVLLSKNKFATVISRREGTFLIGRLMTSLKLSAVSKMSRMSSSVMFLMPIRWRVESSFAIFFAD